MFNVEVEKGAEVEYLVIQGLAEHLRWSIKAVDHFGSTNIAFVHSELSKQLRAAGITYENELALGNKIKKAIASLALSLDELADDNRLIESWVIGTSKDCPVKDTSHGRT